VPVVELHVNTPLNHRGLDGFPIGFSDTVDVTGGLHVMMKNAKLGMAVCTPMTGPKPYDLEAAASLQFQW
jgi:hypothetical protein